MLVRDQVLKSLEVAREEKRIGKSLEARVRAQQPAPISIRCSANTAADLPALFIVSQVAIGAGNRTTAYRVEIERAEGDKCERCWKYTHDVGSDPEFPTLCAACSDAIK